jgi:hypothetical protein
MAEWLTRRASNLMIARQMPVVVSLSKKLYTHCSVLVGSMNGFESVTVSL